MSTIDPELEMISNNKLEGYNYRERRHAEWDENYQLYRDKVIINRLTQRQSVHVPLMKQHIRTLLKDVDDMPVLQFENLDNDKQAEVFKNEYWKWTVEHNKMELQDIVDKRQVFLFGRSFDQWQIVDGKVKMTIQDPMDILVSRNTDPFNIHTSRFLTHMHILVPISYLQKNPKYDKKKVTKLIEWHATNQGLLKASTNQRMLTDKLKRMSDLGVSDAFSPTFGETYVELSLNFVYREKEKRKGKYYEDQLFLYVEADDQQIIMKEPLEDVIGVTKDNFFQTHFPYNSWADDLERQDVWSDAIGDIIRTPNKILDSFFSQLVENRTYRNFNMHLYNSSLEGFEPASWEPRPFGMYGIPVPAGGNISEVMQPIEVSDLSESLDEMSFLIGVVEKATGATATQQGVQTENKITLGEVELALGEAKERIKGMSKFYTPAWEERGEMFDKIVEAGADKLDAVKIYKKGRNTNSIYGREISPNDWMTKSGYRCKVWSQDEKAAQDQESLQKMDAVKANMPDNPKVDEVYKRKLLEFAGLDPDEINEAMEFEEQKRLAMQSMIGNGLQMPGMPLPPDVKPQPQLPAGPAQAQPLQA